MKSRWKRCQMSSPPYFRTSRYFRLPSCRTLRFRRNHQKEEENRGLGGLGKAGTEGMYRGAPPTASIRRCAGTVLQRGQSSQAGRNKSSPWHGRCCTARGLISWMNLAPCWTLSRKSHYTIFQEADGTKDRNLRVPQAI